MKKIEIYLIAATVFLCSVIFYSCRKDYFSNDTTVDPKVSWAKEYFKESLLPNEGNAIDPYAYVEDIVQAGKMNKKKRNMKIPIWQKAVKGTNKYYDYVEVPLKYTAKVMPMVYERNPNDKSVGKVDEAILKASLDRLVIYKNKKGKINQRVISFIPSKAYLERHNGDISHNQINKLDKDFDGYLIYRKWNGSFLFALCIKNGEPVRKISLEKSKMHVLKTAFLREEKCETIDVYEWFIDCDYYGDDPNPYNCGIPYSVYIDSYEDCHEVDPCLDQTNFARGGCEGDDEIDYEEQNCNMGDREAGAETVSEDVNSYINTLNTTTRTKIYEWRFLKNLHGLWSYTSKEKGTHKKVGTEWRWESLEHLSHGFSGVAVVASISVDQVSFVPEVGVYNAGGTLNFNYTSSFVCRGTGITLGDTFSVNSPVWNVNN